MKVSIVTLFSANNVGAFLQAYALKTVVERISGQGTCFLRMHSPATENNSKIKKGLAFLKRAKIGQLWFKYKTFQAYKKVAGLLPEDPEIGTPDREYDTVIVGSDEVWNVESKTFFHHRQYFAMDICAKKVIAYAPSAGNCTPASIRREGMDFSGFHSLSARDAATCQLPHPDL